MTSTDEVCKYFRELDARTPKYGRHKLKTKDEADAVTFPEPFAKAPRTVIVTIQVDAPGQHGTGQVVVTLGTITERAFNYSTKVQVPANGTPWLCWVAFPDV